MSTRPHGGRLLGNRLPAIPGSPPDSANLPLGCAFAPRCAHAGDACRDSVPEPVEVSAGQRVRRIRTDITATTYLLRPGGSDRPRPICRQTVLIYSLSTGNCVAVNASGCFLMNFQFAHQPMLIEGAALELAMARDKFSTPKVVTDRPAVASTYSAANSSTLHHGDCFELMRQMPDECVQLVVTSPPYNLGKKYEKRDDFEKYLAWQGQVIDECIRVLAPRGSVCWQVGNYVSNGAIVPLDIALYPAFAKHGLKLRNRIIWHFEHGLHCSNRMSGRHETVLWFTKTDTYTFNLDPIRVPQKYPGKKYFKGPKAGQLSGNPLGKNPGDVWIFPNVKNNHVEKTIHPCQFPVELVERLMLSLTESGDLVFDPFAGAGTTLAAAARHGRRGCGAEKMQEYVEVAQDRILKAMSGTLPVRDRHTPVYDPQKAGNSLTTNPWRSPDAQPRPAAGQQHRLLENRKVYTVES